MKRRAGLGGVVLAVLMLVGHIGHAQERQKGDDAEEVTLQPGQLRVSTLVGTTVVDIEGTEIGEVDEVVISDSGTIATVLAIGGFAGIGEKLVLVPWGELDISSGEDAEGQVRFSLRSMTGEELANSRPPFRYE